MSKRIRSILGFFPYLFVLLFVFITAVKPPADTDLGWHLRYGQYFFQTGHVLRENILSFVWPAYRWVQASWGYDLLVYQVFTRFGFFGLSVAGALLTIAVYMVITRCVSKKEWEIHLFLATILLTQGVPLYYTGMRSQSPSTLFFAILLTLLYPTVTKKIYLFPILFWVWANMHGGFTLGLVIFGIFWLIHSRKIQLGLSLTASILAPLVNPWGVRIYEETLKHSTNTNLRVISEWNSIGQWKTEAMVAFLVFLFVCFLAYRRKKTGDIAYMLSFAGVTYLAFTALRFLIPFAVMATYYAALALGDIRIGKTLKVAGAIMLSLLIIGDTVVWKHYFTKPDPTLPWFSWNNYCGVDLCSEPITAIMRKNPPQGAGYHPYDMGGYLTWRVPMVKTFLDGRMAAWEENGKTPPVVEGDRIIAEREPVTWRYFDSQYHFRWAIVATHSAITLYLDQLVKSGLWTKPYQDITYSYYEKK